MFRLLTLVFGVALAADAHAWDDFNDGETPEQVQLENFTVDGTDVVLVCLWGDRDDGAVPRKCAQMERDLRRKYPRSRIIRINNPSEQELENWYRRMKDGVGVVIVVTHSTPGPDDEWDVWNCEMQPVDIADIFEDEWVIWNGCHTREVCEDADNLLPVKPVPGCVSSNDNTWRRIIGCLAKNAGKPMNRDQVCEEVFGGRWER